MKVTTIIDNSAIDDRLAVEHGLSLYIETETHNILFDAGQTSNFSFNAQTLDIDLSKVDLAILSHGHYDHSGGLAHFLHINNHAPIYLNRSAFSPFYHGEARYIGIDPALKNCDRLIFTDDTYSIDDGLTLYSCNEKHPLFPIDSAGLTILENSVYQNDFFLHEQYLLIEENEKKVLISGCSHKGILNIAHWFQPDHLFGGFHFMNLDPTTSDKATLEAAAKNLLQYKTTYYTGHCTGLAQFEYMKTIMGDKLHPLQGGCVYII